MVGNPDISGIALRFNQNTNVPSDYRVQLPTPKKGLFKYRIRATTTSKLATKHRMPSQQGKRATGKISLDSELFIGGYCAASAATPKTETEQRRFRA